MIFEKISKWNYRISKLFQTNYIFPDFYWQRARYISVLAWINIQYMHGCNKRMDTRSTIYMENHRVNEVIHYTKNSIHALFCGDITKSDCILKLLQYTIMLKWTFSNLFKYTCRTKIFNKKQRTHILNAWNRWKTNVPRQFDNLISAKSFP